MKKILLILVAVMAAMTVSAKQTVVFKGESLTGKWVEAQALVIDKALFANLAEGDVLWVRTDNDVDGATAASENWYQLSVSMRSPWTEMVNSYDISRLKYWSTEALTAAQVSNIKANGLWLGGHFAKILEVAYGSAFTSTAAEYWDSTNEDWSTDSFDVTSWESRQLNGEPLKSLQLGDRITVTFTTTHEDTDEDRWNATIAMYYTGVWEELYQVPAGGKTAISFVVTESNIEKITSGQIQIAGTNCSSISIFIETTDLAYGLNAGNSLVDLSTINGKEVDVDLTRKIDWNTTICLPFNVDDPYTAFGHEGAFYSLKEYNSGLVFTPASTLEAGKPYYATFNMSGIAEEEDKTMTFSFDAVTINTTLTPSAEMSGLTFKGNYTPAMSMTNKYGVACVYKAPDWVWAFYKGGSNTYLPAFSAYIEGTLSASRLDVVFEDGDVTGLTEVRGQKAEVSDYYNLNGQRVAQPTKGLYIVNGKKVIK